MIAICSAVILFIIPSSKKNTPLMKWKDAVTIPWGILLLFGGGLSIAKAFQATGLDNWIGSQLSFITFSGALILVFIIVAGVNFLTEMTSNIAFYFMLLPIMIPILRLLMLVILLFLLEQH